MATPRDRPRIARACRGACGSGKLPFGLVGHVPGARLLSDARLSGVRRAGELSPGADTIVSAEASEQRYGLDRADAPPARLITLRYRYHSTLNVSKKFTLCHLLRYLKESRGPSGFGLPGRARSSVRAR